MLTFFCTGVILITTNEREKTFMRMRKKKHRDDRLNACAEFIINDFEKIKTEEKLFDNDNPVHLEIGCGKGRFITETAKLNPNINFLAAEKNLDVLLLAAEKIKNENIKNVKFYKFLRPVEEKPSGKETAHA